MIKTSFAVISVIALLCLFTDPEATVTVGLWVLAGIVAIFLVLVGVALFTLGNRPERREPPPQPKPHEQPKRREQPKPQAQQANDDNVGRYSFRNVKSGSNTKTPNSGTEQGFSREKNKTQSKRSSADQAEQWRAYQRAREAERQQAQREADEFFWEFWREAERRARQHQQNNDHFGYGFGTGNNSGHSPSVTQNYYETLGVPKTATTEEIKAAFRKKAKTCHPDLFKGDKAKEAEFKKLNEAYHALSGKGTH